MIKPYYVSGDSRWCLSNEIAELKLKIISLGLIAKVGQLQGVVCSAIKNRGSSFFPSVRQEELFLTRSLCFADLRKTSVG